MAKYYQENPYEHLTMDSSGEDEPSSTLSVNAVESFYILPVAYKMHNDSLLNSKATEALRRLYDYKLYESPVANWIDVAYSMNLWVDSDYQNEYKNENKHFTSKYENVEIKLAAGKNADITIIKNSDYVNNPIRINNEPTTNGIYIEVDNRLYKLPLGLDIARVHDLVMVYNYALEQKNTELVEICERELVALEKGHLKEVGFWATDYISQEEKDYIQQQCEYYATQKALVKNNIIPPETEDFKHPTNLNDLLRFSTKISKVYQKELQKQNPNLKKIYKISQKIVKDIYLQPTSDFSQESDLQRFTGEEVLRLRYEDKLSYKNTAWANYEISSKQWQNQKGENYSLRLATGKYSYIDVCKGYQFDEASKEWVDKTGVYAVVNKKRIKLPSTVKLQDVAMMLRRYEVVLAELNKNPKNETYLQYKNELESIFEKVAKGELKEFPYPKCHYDNRVSNKATQLADYARFLSLKTKLINQGKIPAETEKNKYCYRKDYRTYFRKLELKTKNNNVQYE